jgi:hypothetical protein
MIVYFLFFFNISFRIIVILWYDIYVYWGVFMDSLQKREIDNELSLCDSYFNKMNSYHYGSDL